MSVLGLNETEEAVYRHFLRNPGTSAADLHILLHRDEDAVHRAVARLRELQLLRGGEHALLAADPEVAVTRLSEDRLVYLHIQLQNVTRTRPIIESLYAECRSPADPSGPTGGIERLEQLDRIRHRIDDLAFFAHSEILSAEPYTALSQENIDHARPLDLRCLRRGVRVRNLVRKEALDDSRTLGYLRELVGHGAEIRVAPDFTELILVYDRHTALVPLDPQDTSRGALVAQESGLVANIIMLFERLWDDAEPFTDTEEAEPQEPELSDIERRALHAMCTVHKDEIGARELGVSLRTYRRHVADLLRLLGASNRAQAALLARERGWI